MAVTLSWLTEQLELSEQLRAGRETMLEPQDLPGRFGRVIHGIDRVLGALDVPAVMGGGWAVWRHGYVARVTQFVDIVLPADRIDDFLRTAAVAGFEVLTAPAGRWPKANIATPTSPSTFCRKVDVQAFRADSHPRSFVIHLRWGAMNPD